MYTSKRDIYKLTIPKYLSQLVKAEVGHLSYLWQILRETNSAPKGSHMFSLFFLRQATIANNPWFAKS